MQVGAKFSREDKQSNKLQTVQSRITFLFSAITPTMKDNTPKKPTVNAIFFIVTAIVPAQD